MFSTRLNPTKPPATHRAVLERVGAACRELRPIEDACWATGRPNDQMRLVLEKHGVLGVGTPIDQGGAGDDPLLVAMAAERIGREGLRPARWFALQIAAGYATRFKAAEQSPSQAPFPSQTLLPPDASWDAEGNIKQLLSADLLWEPTTVELVYVLNLKFCLAAGGIGVVADCLETIVTFCAERTKAAAADLGPEVIEHHVAGAARYLEATRAIAYAAAALKTEFDHRPYNEHLRLEAGTLVNEALYVSWEAVAWMLARDTETTGKLLAECLPLRHRAFAGSLFTVFPRDIARSLTKQIARYYLSE